jgi:hypothetical protein
MKADAVHRLVGAVLAGACAGAFAQAEAGTSPVPARWELLVPSGQVGRFALRVERAEFDGTVTQVAARLGREWARDPWPVLGEGGPAGPELSRLTPAGIESISLRVVPAGRVEARRSLLEWRREPDASPAPAGLWNGARGSAFIASLEMLGAPVAGFASRDGRTSNVTRAWVAPGDVQAASGEVEQAARRHGLSRLLRFDAPADAPRSLRGGRVLAFGGPDTAAVATLSPYAGGTAVVVHFQERLP